MPSTLVKSANLLVRFLLELFALESLGYWGFASGENVLVKFLLGVGTPVLAAIVGGLFVSPKAAVSLAMPLRLLPEALVFGSAAAALLATGHPALAAGLAVVAAVNRLLMISWE